MVVGCLCFKTNKSTRGTRKKQHFILAFFSQSTIFQRHVFFSHSYEANGGTEMKVYWCRFFSFSSTNRIIIPAKSNLHQLALSVARDPKLLPFLIRQFCEVNCKSSVSLLSTNLETGTGKSELNPRAMLGEHEKKLANRESEATC